MSTNDSNHGETVVNGHRSINNHGSPTLDDILLTMNGLLARGNALNTAFTEAEGPSRYAVLSKELGDIIFTCAEASSALCKLKQQGATSPSLAKTLFNFFDDRYRLSGVMGKVVGNTGAGTTPGGRLISEVAQQMVDMILEGSTDVGEDPHNFLRCSMATVPEMNEKASEIMKRIHALDPVLNERNNVTHFGLMHIKDYLGLDSYDSDHRKIDENHPEYLRLIITYQIASVAAIHALNNRCVAQHAARMAASTPKEMMRQLHHNLADPDHPANWVTRMDLCCDVGPYFTAMLRDQEDTRLNREASGEEEDGDEAGGNDGDMKGRLRE